MRHLATQQNVTASFLIIFLKWIDYSRRFTAKFYVIKKIKCKYMGLDANNNIILETKESNIKRLTKENIKSKIFNVG